MRGSGVGFYVKEYLNVHILEELSLFENKILEALTIKISYPDNRKVIISSIYRSNGSLPNVTPSQQMDRFLEKFSTLLAQIQNLKVEAYICMDSNIDLLELNIPNHANFLNLVIEKGFLPSICKATRCENESKTLIDQILFNKNCENFYSGTIVSDTSDHFITFIALPGRCKYSHTKNAATQSRDYSMQNLNLFKAELAIKNWYIVYNSPDVNTSYNEFGNTVSIKYVTMHVFPLSVKDLTRPFIKKSFHDPWSPCV
jgi:hypothetical protein